MVIYGIALLGICTLIGLIVGKWLGELFGIDANVGGIGIAMFLLMILSNYQNFDKFGGLKGPGLGNRRGAPSELSGATFIFHFTQFQGALPKSTPQSPRFIKMLTKFWV